MNGPANTSWLEEAVNKSADVLLKHMENDASSRVHPHKRLAKEYVCWAIMNFLAELPTGVNMKYVYTGSVDHIDTWTLINGLNLIQHNLYERDYDGR